MDRLIFYRIIEANVLIGHMKFYENYMATLVEWQPFTEKKSNDISHKTTETILMKFHI